MAKTTTPSKAADAEKAYIRAVHGRMVHLFTNEELTADPKKIEVDAWVQAQLDAGKLEVVTD